jgi:hypothetical protein
MGQRKKLVNSQNCMNISITYTFMKYYQSDKMEEDMMGKMCSTQARAHKHIQSSLRFDVLAVKMTKMIKIFISVLEEGGACCFNLPGTVLPDYMPSHFRRQYYISRSLIRKHEGTILLDTHRKNWQIIVK